MPLCMEVIRTILASGRPGGAHSTATARLRVS
jgi:hypothetical protein